MNDFFTSMKGASQRIVGSVADAGAKTMLKTDMAFLERDIKARKQAFGIIVYDILRSNSIASTTPSATISAADVQRAFEECRGDIEALEDKLRSKRREMEAIDGGHVGGGGGAGALVGEDAEAPGIPQNP